jgi:3-hydroxybutyryl-CoA dehydrogenase
MEIEKIQKVVFVGAGTMGSFNSLVAAVAGFPVTVYDASPEALEALPERQKAWGEILIERWPVPREKIELGLKRIQVTMDPAEAAADADLLSESVFERLELKRQVHGLFDELCPPKTIITTNTSTLLLSDIESAVRRGDRFAAMHFHQPGVLVDLVAGPRTSPEIMGLLKEYLTRIGMTYVVLKKERAGYLHNAMFVAYLATGLMLKILGGMEIEEIDRSWMISQKAESGPFGALDHVGFNVVVDAFNGMQNPDDPASFYREAAMNFFRPYLERGEMGSKTGKGFYSYPEPAFQMPDFLEGREENPLATKALTNSIMAAALNLLVEGVGDIRDIDRSWMIPHRTEIGPLGMIDAKGFDVFLQELEERAALDPVFARTFPLLAEYLKGYIGRGELGVKTGKGFYSYPDPAYKKLGFLLTGE